MEITVYPRSFGIQAGKTQTATGEVDIVKVNIQDAGSVLQTPNGPIMVPGPVVTVVFDPPSWDLFKEAIVDPEEAAKKQEAKSRILVPTGLLPKIKQNPTGLP